MEVKIKKLVPEAKIPTYAKDGDAGMDLYAVYKTRELAPRNIVYGTGLAFEIPKGYVGLIFPRSSNSKQNLMLTNHVGVVDSGYRGEILMKFRDLNIPGLYVNRVPEYEVGDKIGQILIIPYPQVEFKEVEELEASERGEGGYGSTGR